MRKVLVMSSAVLVSTALLTGSAFAGSNANSGEMVWAIKDITHQEHATITNDVYGSDGKVISSRTVNAPSGSLVEFDKETLARAQANGQDYIASSEPIGPKLFAQFSQLHQELLKQLHPTGVATSNSLLQPAASVGGQIGTGFDSGVVDYSVTYTNGSSNSVTLGNFSTFEAQGGETTYQWEVDWENTSHTWSNTPLPQSSSKPLVFPLGWTGTQGQDFYDNVVGSNLTGTVYSGLVTIN